MNIHVMRHIFVILKCFENFHSFFGEPWVDQKNHTHDKHSLLINHIGVRYFMLASCEIHKVVAT